MKVEVEYPCPFMLKVMGKTDVDLAKIIAPILLDNNIDIESKDVTVNLRPSKKGHYVSVTVNFEAQSKDQLDKIYIALNAKEEVIMVL